MQIVTTYTVIDCPACGVLFAVTSEYEDRRRDDGKGFYCPSGHSMSYGNSVKEQLEREKNLRARTAARLDQVKAERDSIERSRRATKGQLTRVKNRVSRGVCPCCNRSFSNLERHMTTKHPDYAHVETEPVQVPA